MLTRLFFVRSACWLLILAISGCTSLRSYGLDEIDSDLPIDVGDQVTIYLNDENFTEKNIVVTEITGEAITGTLVSDPTTGVSFPRDEIGRVEERQFDGVKTSILGLGILFSIYLLGDIADSVNDSYDSATDDVDGVLEDAFDDVFDDEDSTTDD
jgi:hypothetical protein